MRPAMSDSLSSGQPLYLLYSYSNRGVAADVVLLTAAFATHATGNVSLHVTGSPQTTSLLDSLVVQASMPRGNAAAARPCTTSLREKEYRFAVSASLRRPDERIANVTRRIRVSPGPGSSLVLPRLFPRGNPDSRATCPDNWRFLRQ